MFRADPGECPVCGAAHAACTAGPRGGSIEIVAMPSRDAEVQPVRLVAEVVQDTLPAGQVTTGTYRRVKR